MTNTAAPAAQTPDPAVEMLAAGHVPDFPAVHPALLGSTPLTEPMTLEQAIASACPDGTLAAVVEVSLYDLMEGRAREGAGEDYPVAAAMVAEHLEPAAMGYEVVGTRPTNVRVLAARFDLREALQFDYSSEELDELFGGDRSAPTGTHNAPALHHGEPGRCAGPFSR